MISACTLLLTHGTHVIDEPSACEVERAMDSGAASVDITLDVTGSGNTLSRARLSMAHVVAVIRHPHRAVDAPLLEQAKLYALRAR
ncbi:MAG: hypothetical protein ABSB70_18320 [Candidatus Velthaea sp.]